MILLLDILIFIAAIIIAVQDIKYRQVYTIVIVGFITLLCFKSIHLSDFIEITLLEFLINLIIVSMLLLLLFVYFKFLRKTALLEVIGMGDILLFVAFAFAFQAQSFIIQLTLSFLFSLVMHFLVKRFYVSKKTVPLAGFMCIYFIAVQCLEYTDLKIPVSL